MPDNTGKKQDSRFKKGQSGNPSGRPAGSRNKTTMAMQALLDGEAESLTRKALDMALGGDLAALKICLERLLPAIQERTINFTMPPIKNYGDALKALNSILQALANGEITLSEAIKLNGLIDQVVCAVNLKKDEANEEMYGF